MKIVTRTTVGGNGITVVETGPAWLLDSDAQPQATMDAHLYSPVHAETADGAAAAGYGSAATLGGR